MKKYKYINSILIGTVVSIALSTNVSAYAAQADGNVDSYFVEKVNGQLRLLPDDLIDSMEEDGVSIFVTDKNIDSYFMDGQYGSVMGVTINENGYTNIYIEDREKAVCEATLHEVGHWLDSYCGNVSSTGEFSQIYSAETNAFCDTFLVNFYYDVHEFYAEGFWKFLTDPEVLQDNCPQLYAILESNLDNIKARTSFTCG